MAMAQSQIPLPLATLITELQRLCEAGKTGHLIVMTARKRSATFKLAQGRILAVNYAMKSGVEALDLLAQDDMGTSTFVELAAKGAPPTTSLSNDEVFQRLGGLSALATAMKPATPVSSHTLSPRDYAMLETTLANYIGPIAQLICRQMRESVSEFETAVATLMREIPDKDQAAAFAVAVQAAHAKVAEQ